MDIETLNTIPQWEWPENTDSVLLGYLQDRNAAESERILAAELAGDPVAINDRLANVLLSITEDDAESAELRGTAAIALGPILELGDLEGFDEYSDVEVTEETFLGVQKKLHLLYQLGEMPERVQRQILEASVRALQDWHADAVRAAFYSSKEDWKLTAVFCMHYVPGFDNEILEALGSPNPDIHFHAVRAAGSRELDQAFAHVASIVRSAEKDKSLVLAAIDAVAEIRPKEAADVLAGLFESEDEDIVEAVHEALVMSGEMGDEEDGWFG